MPQLPRTIWIYWDTGWGDAPDLSKRALASWRKRNPTWTVQKVDLAQVDALLGPGWRKTSLPDWITPTSLSDLVRLALLERFGGVWVDATTFCVRPLDHWIDHHTAASGFFAFAKPTDTRPLASWFLAAQPGNMLVSKWLDRCWQYWAEPNQRESKWVHRQFAELIEQDPAAAHAWACVDTISARNPLHMGPNHKALGAPVTEEMRACIRTKSVPVAKLTNRRSVTHPDAALNWLSRALTKPASGQPKCRLILHVGLPKTATTTIQTWADTHRDALAARGVIYPVPRRVTNMPKHQELVNLFLKGTQAPIIDLLKDARPNTTLFLSAEGLTGHILEAEAQPDHLAWLRDQLSVFDTTLFMMTRRPDAWLRSYHQQTVRNNPNDTFGYATAEPRDVFAQRPRVQAMLDTQGMADRIKVAYGTDKICVTDLDEDWAEVLCTLLGVPEKASQLRTMPRSNEGLSAPGTEFLRQANARGFKTERDVLIALLQNPKGMGGAHLPSAITDIVAQFEAHTDEGRALLADIQDAISKANPM